MMKRNGFTLQEALITVGIIGIIAAITVPGIVKMMPDRNQQIVLKTYETLTKLNQEMLIDSSLYWNDSDGQGCDGLACADAPIQGSVSDDLLQLITLNQNNIPQWVGKYASILAYNMNMIPQQFGYRQTNGRPTFNFTTTNGFLWRVMPNNANNANDSIIVSVNVDGPLANNNVFRANNPRQEVNTFEFNITADGRVQGNDMLTIAYLTDPTNSHAKKDLQDSYINRGRHNLDDFTDLNKDTNKLDSKMNNMESLADHNGSSGGNNMTPSSNDDVCGGATIFGTVFDCGSGNKIPSGLGGGSGKLFNGNN